MNLKHYYRELKRRNVLKAAAAYLVVGWVILQAVAIIFPMFNIPKGVSKAVFFILLIGLPVWLVFAWVYEVTPEGLKKTENISEENSSKPKSADTGGRLVKITLTALVLAIVLLGINLYSNYTGPDESEISENNKETTSAVKNKEKTDSLDKSVAVLAFEDMSPKKDQEYFSDGISEEILNQLAKNPELDVISRTSSFYFKGKEATTQEIGKKLHVNYLLEGSIRKAGEVVRITAQLIKVPTQTHIWSHTYDRKLEDIFKLQDEIAKTVSKNMEVSILGEETKTMDPKAYEYYLEAKYLAHKLNPEDLKKSLSLVKKAVKIDPNYAPAWSLMGGLYYNLGLVFGEFAKEETMEELGKAAKKSIETDPTFSEGYYVLAHYHFSRFHFRKAKETMLKAMELDPDNSRLLRSKAFLLFESPEQMIKNINKAIEKDPLRYTSYQVLALAYLFNGEFEKAMGAINHLIEKVPEAATYYGIKSWILINQGKAETALKTAAKEINPNLRLFALCEANHSAGNNSEAKRLLQEYITKYPKEPSMIATLYAFMGEREKTFEYLNKAVENKDPNLSEVVYYLEFGKYHPDPRWQQLLEELGVPEDNGIPGYHK